MIGRNGWLHGSEEMAKPKAITLPNPPLEVMRQYASTKPLHRLVPRQVVESEPPAAPQTGANEKGQVSPHGS
ncbi:MAG: hypothetical protein JNM56_06165 [Planctomycetia bacterium]|nr:hypothetical protein [Planctomycetia bacterium]